MLNEEQIDLIYRIFTKQISDMDMVFLSETVGDGSAEEEFIHLLVRRVINPLDFQEEMFKVISENITKEALTFILKEFFNLKFKDSSYTSDTKVISFINEVMVYTFKEYFNVDVDERRRLSDSPDIHDYGKVCRFIQAYPDFKEMDKDTLRWRGFTLIADCNNLDFESFINYEGFLRTIPTIVKYVDLDRLSTMPKDRLLSVRQVLKLGVTHKNLRDLNQDLFEGFSEKEFNDFVNYHLDEICYSVITESRGRLKNYLSGKLRGEVRICANAEKDLRI